MNGLMTELILIAISIALRAFDRIRLTLRGLLDVAMSIARKPTKNLGPPNEMDFND
jgi:hypothetical protein